ncbi:KLTH0H09636p [Lachancea thermotolerans CBS 6340]|uniref:KLTH0H09636p n=1 Tax=Lachancea thermotolerans (strain ATCC 56472 / CBS 6340 / NRRL Y-8284) TaxID=559295 RepID=C5E321_LACTC|nr:KLTH0H09636p [Lachancea thermotolerans CBS 6340]CAR30432.1 KLTH0H09636p [Lachancea thermotolerans CBS 6340]
MRLNWPKRQSAVISRDPHSGNEDLLSSDASLKAAQAIFKKHSFSSEDGRPDGLAAPSVQPRHKTGNTTRPHPSKALKKRPRAAPKPSMASQTAAPSKQVAQVANSAAACAAAATAQKTTWTIEPQGKPKNKVAQYFTPNQLKPPVTYSASRSNSRSGSIRSRSSSKSDDFADIVAQLQGNHDAAQSQRSARVGSVSPRANASSDSIASSHMSSDEMAQAHAINGSNGPPLLSSISPRHSVAGKGYSDFHSSEVENNSIKPSETPTFLNARGVSTRTLPDRRSPPRVYLKDTDAENASTSSLQSSAFSGLPNGGAEVLSEPEYAEYGVSPNTNTNPYRHDYPRSSIDQSSGTMDLNSDRLSYETLSKMPVQVKYHGTLPDLIPNHKREKKRGRLSSLFGRKHKIEEADGSQTDLIQQNDVAVVKATQPTRLKTTMRAQSEDQAVSSANESSDEYESGSEDEFGTADKKKKPRRRRVHIRRQIKKASGHHNSSDKSFNEDKPWKSHIDIGFVTQAERKRYEGMWVTNRNCYLELLPWWQTSGEQQVYVPDEGLILNLVVLDIWSRSNLPQDKLASIYDMVDFRKDGTLERKSFIVGMWLVDQSLYGRKLPAKIEPRVWESVDKYVVNVPSEAQVGFSHKDKQRQIKQEIKSLKKDLKRVQL